MSGDDEDPLRRVRLAKLEKLRGSASIPIRSAFRAPIRRPRSTSAMPRCRPAPRPTNEVRSPAASAPSATAACSSTCTTPPARSRSSATRTISPPEELALLRLLDIGDIIGVEGRVRRTPRGELTVNATALTVLAKALRPLPEKYHGLADIELRYRQRYLDLIMNEESRETLRRRSRIIAAMRAWLLGARLSRGRDADAAHHPRRRLGQALRHPSQRARPRALSAHRARAASEAAAGRRAADKLFEINRYFRNEGLSPRHNPEFTSLELYQAYVDYTAMMSLAEADRRAGRRTAAGRTAHPAMAARRSN